MKKYEQTIIPQPKKIGRDYAGEIKSFINKKKIKHGAQYGKYIAPTVGLFKGAGKLGLGVVKLASRIPGPLLAASVVYDVGKFFGKKASKGFTYPDFPQFDKRGRRIY